MHFFRNLLLRVLRMMTGTTKMANNAMRDDDVGIVPENGLGDTFKLLT